MGTCSWGNKTHEHLDGALREQQPAPTLITRGSNLKRGRYTVFTYSEQWWDDARHRQALQPLQLQVEGGSTGQETLRSLLCSL